MNRRISKLLALAVLFPAGLALYAQSPVENRQSSIHPTAFAGLKFIEPVRFGIETGDALSNQIAAARTILAPFSKAGFRAVWAVDAAPAETNGLAEWTRGCLGAFAEPPVLALDIRLDGKVLKPAIAELRPFLAYALPAVHSVVLNYTTLNNFSCANNETDAIAALRAVGALVRELAPKTFAWLFLDDDPTSCERIPLWARALCNDVQGYYLYSGHGLNALSEPRFAQVAAPLLASGKPVLRGGFVYSAPRSRPGIEQDLKEQYVERLTWYEAWLTTNRYAGYTRLIGKAIPAAVSPNMDLLPK